MQCTLLMDMLSTLIKTETSVSNILEVARVTRGGAQFLTGSSMAFPSVAEQTLKRYAGGDDSTKGSETTVGSYVKCKFWGCSLPHPWSKKEKGQYVVTCPNANKPGICEHTTAQIKDFQVRRGRKHAKGTKRKNVNTLNWDDIPSEHHTVLLKQHHSGSVVTIDGGSVASSITGATTTWASGIHVSHITLHQDIIILAGTSSLPPNPIVIHSPMAHITLQTGTSNEVRIALISVVSLILGWL